MIRTAQGKSVYAIATMDTKGEELAYVARCVKSAGASVRTVDVGTMSAPVVLPDISREQVAAFHVEGHDAVLKLSDRGRAVSAMSEALVKFIQAEYELGR